jgi:hypothetical protein
MTLFGDPTFEPSEQACSLHPAVPGLRPPAWHEVEVREYHEWTTGRIVLDTAGRTAAECLETLLAELRAWPA